jgi:ABC-type multidrug transport system ATPase subunit
MSSDAVVLDGIVKHFGDTTALDGVSCAVAPGEVFGFIGPDGAGKTTLFRILATLMVPDGGSARVLGLDVVADLWAIRKRLGYMPGRFALYPDLSVEENLRFFAAVFGTTIEAEQERIGPIYSQLAPFKDRRAAALSGGMKQKLALCCALVHRPELLLLDEPTTGVDAVARRDFWDLLARLKAAGLTIVVSTPYMDEADRCDRVALIQRGRILALDTPAGITRSFDRPLFAVKANERYPALVALRASPDAHSVYPFGETIHYTDRRPNIGADQIERELTGLLAAKGITGTAVAPISATIEDSFMAQMGAPEGEEEAATRGAPSAGREAA